MCVHRLKTHGSYEIKYVLLGSVCELIVFEIVSLFDDTQYELLTARSNKIETNEIPTKLLTECRGYCYAYPKSNCDEPMFCYYYCF